MCRAPAVHAAGPSRTHATLARLAAAAATGLRRGAAPTRGRAGAAPPDAHPAAALGTICTHGAPAHAAGAARARPRAAVGVGPAALGRRVAAPRDAAAAARTIHSAAAVAGLAAVERTAREAANPVRAPALATVVVARACSSARVAATRGAFRQAGTPTAAVDVHCASTPPLGVARASACIAQRAAALIVRTTRLPGGTATPPKGAPRVQGTPSQQSS